MLRADTVPELLQRAATQQPEAEAFRYRDERIDYRAWNELAGRMAAALWARGVRRGDVVALLLPSTPLYLIAYLGAARLGAVTTGINTRYRRTEIGHILRRSGARALIAVKQWHDADFEAAVASQRDELPHLRTIDWLSAAELCASTRQCVARLAQDAEEAPSVAVRPEVALAIVFTSGTTGTPKGAWFAHRSVLALAEIDARRYATTDVPFRKHLAAGLSFAHIGTMARIAVQIGHVGMSIIHDAFDPAAVLALIERERLADLGGIPTQIIMLLDHPNRPQHDLSSLRTILLGGAPSSPQLIRRIQRELHVAISVRYSSTEVGIATASLPSDPVETLSTTVGKATPGVELRIVDGENRALAAGAVGEVVIRSPATMRGYWQDGAATSRVVDSQGWIHTGDLGFVDAADYLHLCGRQSEMYIRGGYNVYPAEVEDLLTQHPKIARAAIIGAPDARLGEIGWAFVVPRPSETLPSLEELRKFVGAQLASFKRPDGLTIVSELPLTPMFKVDKHQLRAMLEAQLQPTGRIDSEA